MSGKGRRIRTRPNFFLGVQINNSEIHKKIKQLQEDIIKRNCLLHPALVHVATLHLTLAVTHLKSEAEVKLLKDKLDLWTSKNRKLFFDEPITLNFTGLGVFRNCVAYVDVEKCENYQKLVNISKSLCNMIESCNFLTDKKSFTPHVTVLKLSKNYELLKQKNIFKNEFEIFKQCSDHFGSQKIYSIQLLSMDEPKCENGYYKSFHQIDVQETEHDDIHHLECCQPIPAPEKNEMKSETN